MLAKLVKHVEFTKYLKDHKKKKNSNIQDLNIELAILPATSWVNA